MTLPLASSIQVPPLLKSSSASGCTVPIVGAVEVGAEQIGIGSPDIADTKVLKLPKRFFDWLNIQNPAPGYPHDGFTALFL